MGTMQAKPKSHQKTSVGGVRGVQLYPYSCIPAAEKAPSHKQTCTALHLPLAHASFSCKIGLFLNIPLRIIFTHVGQLSWSALFFFFFNYFSHFPCRLLLVLQLSCESVFCSLMRNILLQRIFFNRGLSQGKMPAEIGLFAPIIHPILM